MNNEHFATRYNTSQPVTHKVYFPVQFSKENLAQKENIYVDIAYNIEKHESTMDIN